MTIARWIAFAWGCLAFAIVVHFEWRYVTEPTNPLRPIALWGLLSPLVATAALLAFHTVVTG